MKKLFIPSLLLALTTIGSAALITRTYTYTAGNTITANENNTNENTLYNEFNGNIESANIKDATITNGDIGDTQIGLSKFSSDVQSTFTYVFTLGTYRRPVLKFVGVTSIDVENNTGVLNQTCIHFPDQRRCVTEDTSATSVNRRFIITETASFTGTKNSGLNTGESEAINTWYALYAVKVQDNTTDFVIAGSTNQPIQANFSVLNARFGTNSWVYLGMIRNGDASAATGDIVSFIQNSNLTLFNSATTGTSINSKGIRLATTASASSLTYSIVIGTGNAMIPSNLTSLLFGGYSGTGVSNTTAQLKNGGNTVSFVLGSQTNGWGAEFWYTQNNWLYLAGGASAIDLYLNGFIDSVLGPGYNAQL